MTECSERPEDTKQCTKCQETKKSSEFPKSSRFKSGFNSKCKCCLNTSAKTWREENPKNLKAEEKNITGKMLIK